jgi:hypothetical protein
MEMKNGVYITIHKVNDDYAIGKNPGVINKIKMQYSVLEKYFNMRMDIYNDIGRSFWLKLLSRVPFYPAISRWKHDDCAYLNIDFLYIRIDLIDKYFINFLRSIKKKHQKIIILAEIPTYPIDRHFRNLKGLPLLLKSYLNRNKLNRYIDKIATSSFEKKIFGIDTITMLNGVDFSKIKVVSEKKNDSIISLIAVATLTFYHGYDRLIRGLANYYAGGGTETIHFHIVGKGQVFNFYKKLIKVTKLDNNVFLHGFKQGFDLDELYNNADFGISSLACHRIGIYRDISLKSIECFARGLPIIASSKIDILPIDFKYCCFVPEDDSPVDITSIINFYNTIYNNQSKSNVVLAVRKFAEEKFDISKTMAPVIDYFLYG